MILGKGAATKKQLHVPHAIDCANSIILGRRVNKHEGARLKAALTTRAVQGFASMEDLKGTSMDFVNVA